MSGAMTVRRRTRTVTEWACRCERCGHKWVSRGPKPPISCAGCTARGWNRPARPYRRRTRVRTKAR